MTEQDQTPPQDDDTEGHSWRAGKTADRRKDDDIPGHVRPPRPVGDDDTTGHGFVHGGKAAEPGKDDDDDDSEGWRLG